MREAIKYILETKGGESSESEIQTKIHHLRAHAINHKDFDKTIQFMDAIADFKTELLKSFSEEDLIQIPLYHELIGSGMPQGVIFEVPVASPISERVVNAIRHFVTTELEPLID